MTVINGIEIDDIVYTKNDIKRAVENNDPLEDKLHVIAVISNPCLYARRYILMKEFMHRMEHDEKNIVLYIVELAYGDQRFLITDSANPRHLQLRTETPLWHKENMINLGVKYLLPSDYKAFAWVDADLEFESATWALDTLKVLNGAKDIVQLYSHAVDMNRAEDAMTVFSSFGYNYCKNKQYSSVRGSNYWHSGYAWAITRKAYERIGGLYEYNILGAGDYNMALSIIRCLDNYPVLHEKMKGLRMGYVPGVIRHFFHGSKANRKYVERGDILKKHEYDELVHVTKDEMGLIVPTAAFSEEFKQDIYQYFLERKEDD